MKKINYLKSIGISLLSVALLFFSSCSSTPDSIKLIPKETNVVSVIDVMSIAKKGKLDKLSERNFYKMLQKEARSENKKIAEILEKVVENPTITGINFSKDIFIYYTNAAKDEEFNCMSVVIGNKKDFVTFISDVFDKTGVKLDIKEDKEYDYTVVKDKMAIGWNGNMAVFLTANNYKSRENIDIGVKTLFKLKENEQVTANDDFNKFYKNKKDISVWFSSNLYKEYFKQSNVDFSDSYFSLFLNFENEKISIKSNFTPNEELQALIEEFNILDNKFNSDILKLFPKKTFAVASSSMNPVAFYESFKKQDEKSIKKVEEGLKQADLDFKKIIESIGGSFVLSLLDFEKQELTYKTYGYGFDITKAHKMNKGYGIDKVGKLTNEQKEELNAGKTITVAKYNKEIFFNIKNIIDEGGNVETAIKTKKPINFYAGGWNFGRFVEKKTETTMPVLSFAFDIKNTDIITKILKIAPKELITKKGNHYEFKIDNKYSTYFAFNKNFCIFSNSKKAIETFEKGGYSENIGDNDFENNITDNAFYAYMNLDYNLYPKFMQDMANKMSGSKQSKFIEEWGKFAKSIEFIQDKNNLFELVLTLKEVDDNSLNTLITTIDETYEDLM